MENSGGDALTISTLANVGDFGRSALISGGLGKVLELVESQESIAARLSPHELAHLVNHSTLPQLLKLIEAKRRGLSESVRCRPVVMMPFAEWLEQSLRKYSAEQSIELLIIESQHYLARLSESINLPQRIYLALDSWSGKFSFETLITLLDRSGCSKDGRYVWLGPSTVDVRQIIAGTKGLEVESVLEQLWKVGVRFIEGGADVDILRSAARLGFDIGISQHVTLNKDELVGQALERSVQEMLALGKDTARKDTADGALLHVWFPWSKNKLDGEPAGGDAPLGGMLLKLIALARLLLPEARFIRAPVSLLGLKAAHVALEFGANDLGFVALDVDSANNLGIAKWSEVRETLELRRGTEVRLG